MAWADVEAVKEHRRDLLREAQRERLLKNNRVQSGRVRALIEYLRRQR